MRTLGARLRALRVDIGLTGAVLAQRAGVGQPTVSKVENGRMVPSRAVLDRLSGVLGLDAALVTKLRVALAEGGNGTWRSSIGRDNKEPPGR
ncbi:helix-turn-helix domain-containing protein [Streptomyces aureus]|uniref:helix-turn-helix domain-containing protein n=1 Tax=Streptomyces aureus TaxID=193461 RepID=UPI00368A2F67